MLGAINLSYPESIPEVNNKNFFFSFEKASKSYAKIYSDSLILEDRIEKILSSEKFYVSDYPVLRQIMVLNPNKNELKLLAKAIERLSDLVENHNSITQKLNVFKVIEEDPNWLALSFGDFSHEIDNDIESFYNTLES